MPESSITDRVLSQGEEFDDMPIEGQWFELKI